MSKIYLVFTFFAIKTHITKGDKKTFHTVFNLFEKMLQSVTCKESVMNFKSVTKNYYKVWDVLQCETEFITKCGRYYKVHQKRTTKCVGCYKVLIVTDYLFLSNDVLLVYEYLFYCSNHTANALTIRLFFDFQPSWVTYMTQQGKCSLRTKDDQNFFMTR